MQEPQPLSEAGDVPWQMDIILPAQYFGALRGVGLCSEQRLMLAVLVDAINVLHGWHRVRSGRKRCAFAEAARWVNTCGTSDPFSFDSVCDALGIDSEVLRSRLHALTIGLANSAHAGLGRLPLTEFSRTCQMTAERRQRRGGRQIPIISS